MYDMHEQDRQFLQELKEASLDELLINLQFQACEDWRRIAIERELDKRLGNKTSDQNER
jgi:hypothetical protein